LTSVYETASSTVIVVFRNRIIYKLDFIFEATVQDNLE